MSINPFELLLPLASIAATALVLLAAVAATRVLLHRGQARRGRTGSHYIDIAAPPEVEPDAALGAWATLGGIERRPWAAWWRGQPHLIWQYAWRGGAFTVRVWVPSTLPHRMVVKAIQAAWPGSRCTVTDAHAPLPDTGQAAGGHLVWRAVPEPVTTDTTTDALRALVETGPTATEAMTAAVQVVAAPATRRQINRLRRSAEGPNASPTFWSELASIVRPRPAEGKTAPEPAWVREHRQILRKRLAAQCWNVGIRWATIAPRIDAAQAHATELGYAVAALAGVGHHRRTTTRARGSINTWAKAARTQVLTAAELAQLAHLPSDAIVPSLPRAGSRPIAPVPAIPSGGFATKVLGTAAVGGRKVALRAADARKHLHIVGKTGSGKSTLLQHLALADVRDRRGLVVIDPKGDLVDDLLDRIDPDAARGRLYLIDPRQDRLPGLDPLAGTDPDLVVENLVGICRSIWEKFWGPRADDILRYSCKTLLAATRPFSRLPNLLISDKYRHNLLEDEDFERGQMPGDDPLDVDMTGIRAFWGWYNDLPPGIRTQAAGPVLTRMRALLARSFVRSLFGDPEYEFDLDRVLNRGGIVLARLPKGELGEDTSRLIGSVLVSKVWQVATARSAWPEAKRRDLTLMMDEAHNFLNLPNRLDDMLAEARAYHLSLVMAHQYVAQMPREMQFAVSSQARNKFFFPVGPEDAHVLARHTPQLTPHDLANLDDYTAVVQLHAAGKDQPAFTLDCQPPAEPVGKAGQVRADAAAHLTPVPPKKDKKKGVDRDPKSPGKPPGKSHVLEVPGEIPGEIPPDSPGRQRNNGEVT
ncbi:type IV secretory system conjugative DNA transfer family protein [Glycomyces sp. MUSA5-2]|uniref:type IV secretory system conjugative DNA transfer family protein n=1 Tax=Glycomyces sp. MUSA5-2 TaxID=2053002 RepID=UPI00300A5EC4